MNLKKGLPQAWYRTSDRALWQLWQTMLKVGLRSEIQARQLHMICVGGSLWAVLGCQYKRISDVAGPDQETSL